MTSLMLASSNGQLEVAKELLHQGANIEAKDKVRQYNHDDHDYHCYDYP